METEGSDIKVYGWDSVNEEWIPIQVDVDGKLVVTV
jgi:hypothetical protein